MVSAVIRLYLWGVDVNLLQETIDILSQHSKTIFDIEWFGDLDCEYNCDLQKLVNLDYDNGYGLAEVPAGFVLVGADFWLERHEYDGSECWEYKELPKRPRGKKQLEKLIEFR